MQELTKTTNSVQWMEELGLARSGQDVVATVLQYPRPPDGRRG